MATAPAVPQRARKPHEPSEEPPKLLNTTEHTLRKEHTMLNKEQAIRVSCRGSLTVLIIDPQGFDYPRYVGLEQL